MNASVSQQVFPAKSYKELSKTLGELLPSSRFIYKENLAAISGTVALYNKWSGDFEIGKYLAHKGTCMSVRAQNEHGAAKALRLRKLAGECLVESVAIFGGKQRSEIASEMKSALSKSIAIFDEETQKLADAESLLSKGKGQDARGTLLYVFKYFDMAHAMLSEAQLGPLSRQSETVRSRITVSIGLLAHGKANEESAGDAKKFIAVAHSAASQLLPIMESVLASIEAYFPPKQ